MSLKVLFIFLSAIMLHAQSFNSEQFRSFLENKNFTIKRGYLNVDPIGGFADGRYRLKNYVITRKNEYLYDVKMLFVLKKKRYLRYTKELQVPLLYDKKRVWIKHKGQIYKYKAPQDTLVRYKKSKKLFTERVKKTLNIKMENLFLEFDF